jgi:hypothetical protein
MSFDNRIFDINGVDKTHFELAIDLAIGIAGHSKIVGWSFKKEKGLILHWYEPSNISIHKFISAPNPVSIANMVWDWLDSEEASTVDLAHWDVDMNHDGHNGRGWRIYVDGWGHVGTDTSAICAIKPIYVWYGK